MEGGGVLRNDCAEYSHLLPVYLREGKCRGMLSLKVLQCNVLQVMVTLSKAEVGVDEVSCD